jgi:hypothetical protein
MSSVTASNPFVDRVGQIRWADPLRELIERVGGDADPDEARGEVPPLRDLMRVQPLLDRLLYGRRLDHELAGVDELGQLLLLLQGGIQVYRPHPVEGGPHRVPFSSFFDELA